MRLWDDENSVCSSRWKISISWTSVGIFTWFASSGVPNAGVILGLTYLRDHDRFGACIIVRCGAVGLEKLRRELACDNNLNMSPGRKYRICFGNDTSTHGQSRRSARPR